MNRTKTRKTKIAPGLATVAALLTISAACSTFGPDDDSATAAGASPGPDPGTSSECRVGTGETLEYTVWDEGQTQGGTEQPAAAVVLDQAFDLPPGYGARLAELEFAPGSAWGSGAFSRHPAEGIVEYADGRLGVVVQPEQSDDSARLAVIDPADGTVVAEYDAVAAALAPEPVESGGVAAAYHRIEADGVTLPASTAGEEVNEVYALRLLATRDDSGQVWALLRGSGQLHRGTIYTGDTEAAYPLGEAWDTSGCS